MITKRTTYKRSDGATVHIAGFAHTEPLEGQRVWYSIEADHYLDDGRMVSGRTVYEGEGKPRRYERFVTDCRLLPESADANDPWWRGVHTP